VKRGQKDKKNTRKHKKTQENTRKDNKRQQNFGFVRVPP
jgi:hypothetical protein